MRRVRLGRPVRATVAGLVVVASFGCTADGDEGGSAEADHTTYLKGAYDAPAGALLAEPVTEPEENRTFRKLLANIAHTPPGARIRIAARSFSFTPAAEALVAAAERGVQVQIIVDRSVAAEWSTVELLADGLGTDRTKDSFLHLFRGELHEKWWSFTRTGDSREVTMVGSTNLTNYSSGQYTDMYSFVGRPDVRRAFDGEFRNLLSGDHDGLPGSTALGEDAVWFYPGYSESTDPVLAELSRIPASGAEIDVAMYAWHSGRGLALANLLATKATQGAAVEVVAGKTLGEGPRAILKDAGIPIHDGDFGGDEIADDSHHKLVLASWSADGGRERIILTGSDNWGSPSLLRHEVLVRVDADAGPAARAYRDYETFVAGIIRRSEREES